MYGSKTEQDQGNFSSCFDTIWNLKKWKYTYIPGKHYWFNSANHLW